MFARSSLSGSAADPDAGRILEIGILSVCACKTTEMFDFWFLWFFLYPTKNYCSCSFRQLVKDCCPLHFIWMAQIVEPGSFRDSVFRKVTAVWIQLPHHYVVSIFFFPLAGFFKKPSNPAVSAVTPPTCVLPEEHDEMEACRGAQPTVMPRPQSFLVVRCLWYKCLNLNNPCGNLQRAVHPLMKCQVDRGGQMPPCVW